VHGVQMGNAWMAQQWLGHFQCRPQTRLVQSAQQVIELAKRQVVELVKITCLEEKNYKYKRKG